MTTSELIALLQKNEFGWATGRPRTVNFKYKGRNIFTPEITVDSTEDGMFTEIYLDLKTDEPLTNADKYFRFADDEKIAKSIAFLADIDSLEKYNDYKPSDRLHGILINWLEKEADT